MRVDHVVDERNDPFASSRAAAQLMAYNYSITGNWPMAITAYNHGLAGVRRAMRKYGDTAYVEILRHYNGRTFGFASRNFYVAFLAAKEVDQNPERYFPDLVFERPTEYATLRLPAFVAADGLVQATGKTKRQLAAYNPGLQPTIWTGVKHLPKGYELRMPVAELGEPLTDIVAALPPDSLHDKQLPDMFHRVSRGDTLSQIAAAYDTRVSTLVALNNLNSRHRIRAGQNLRLPAAGPAPVRPAASEPVVVAAAVEPDTGSVAQAALAVDTDAGALQDAVIDEPAEIRTALLSDPSDYRVADDGSIEVQPLETLGHFGDWLEIKTQRLRDINGLTFRAPVEVGQRITLDLGKVDARNFEERRIAYHRRQQDSFFRRHVITGLIDYEIRAGDSIWVLALQKYDVPVWLFRQYNPSLDLDSIRPGTKIQFPALRDVEPDQ
jgi:membrane-bound lytic murein transglycosylase D